VGSATLLEIDFLNDGIPYSMFNVGGSVFDVYQDDFSHLRGA